MNISNLPAELIAQILSFISLRELLRLATISRKFCAFVISSISDRHRHASQLQHQLLSYRLYQPIERFGVGLVKCQAINQITARKGICTSMSHRSSETLCPDMVEARELCRLHSQYTSFGPSLQDTINLRATYVRLGTADHPERTLFLNRLNSSIERRIVFEPEVRFVQFLFNIQISERGLVSDEDCIVSEGVVRVFKDWLDNVATENALTSEQLGEHWWDEASGEHILWLTDRRHIGFRVCVYKVEERGQDGSHVYWVKFCDLLIRSTHMAIKNEESQQRHIRAQKAKAPVVRRIRSISSLRRVPRRDWRQILV